MNETYRRRGVMSTKKYSVLHQVVILLRSRKEFLYLCTRSSLALRVACLCDLYLLESIELSNGVVKIVKGVDNTLLKEFLNKISVVSFEPKKLLKSLNGEMKAGLGVKKLRSKVYKEMAIQNLIKNNKSTVYNKIILQNNTVWEEVFMCVLEECNSELMSLSSIAILVCLNYIDQMENMLLQCNESQAKIVVNKLNNIQNQIIKKTYPQHHMLFYEFLSCLF